MPNSPDHRVKMHRLATERRTAGLPSWRWQIPIKDLLTSDERDEAAVYAAAGISGRLKRGLPGLLDTDSNAYDDDLDDIVYEFEHVSSRDDLNDALESLYDWADTNRLWLG